MLQQHQLQQHLKHQPKQLQQNLNNQRNQRNQPKESWQLLISKFIKKHQYILGAILSGVLAVALLNPRNIAAFLALRYGSDPVNSKYVFFPVRVDNCDMQAFFDSGATRSFIVRHDAEKCFANKTPIKSSTIRGIGGLTNVPIYRVTMKFPDGPSFETDVQVTDAAYNGIGTDDLLKAYNISFTDAGVNLSPKGSV